MRTFDERTRANWHCGYMPREAWCGPVPAYPRAHDPDGAAVDPEQCPGYLMSLPDTIATLEAFPHWDKGTLRDWCGGKPHRILLEYLNVLQGSVSGLESHAFRKARERHGDR
jgi:hypothetical protein